MRMVVLPLVVILTINVDNLLAVNAEGEPPVACDLEAPGPLAVAGQLMSLPDRDCTQLIGSLHILQESQHLAELVQRRRWNPFGVVPKERATDALMDDVPYRHLSSVA